MLYSSGPVATQSSGSSLYRRAAPSRCYAGGFSDGVLIHPVSSFLGEAGGFV